MQEQKYSELEDRALLPESKDAIRNMKARSRIHQEIEAMRAEGKALTLTDEEIRLLESFRRFKIRMRKNGEVFTWQTALPNGVELVKDTAEIIHPNEGGRLL